MKYVACKGPHNKYTWNISDICLSTHSYNIHRYIMYFLHALTAMPILFYIVGFAVIRMLARPTKIVRNQLPFLCTHKSSNYLFAAETNNQIFPISEYYSVRCNYNYELMSEVLSNKTFLLQYSWYLCNWGFVDCHDGWSTCRSSDTVLTHAKSDHSFHRCDTSYRKQPVAQSPLIDEWAKTMSKVDEIVHI